MSNYASIVMHLNIKDTVAPVITLNGELSLTHEAATPYIDAGGEAHDNVDGRVALVMTQNIDVNKLGMQTIKFAAKDAEGNMITAERHVEVVDTTAPVMTINGEKN